MRFSNFLFKTSDFLQLFYPFSSNFSLSLSFLSLPLSHPPSLFSSVKSFSELFNKFLDSLFLVLFLFRKCFVIYFAHFVSKKMRRKVRIKKNIRKGVFAPSFSVFFWISEHFLSVMIFFSLFFSSNPLFHLLSFIFPTVKFSIILYCLFLTVLSFQLSIMFFLYFTCFKKLFLRHFLFIIALVLQTWFYPDF